MADSPAPLSPFSTDEMLETVNTFKRPANGLVKAFFPTVKQSVTKFHHFETNEDKRYVAPLVAPFAPGKVRARKGRKATTVECAYTKENAAISPSEAYERQAGETLGGSATPAERRDVIVSTKLREHYDGIMRRQELMAADAIVRGHNILEGDDYPRVVLDYGRAAELGLEDPANTLTGGDRWNQAGSNPGKFLRAMSMRCVKHSGSWTPNIWMDVDAAEAFFDNPKAAQKLDMLKLDGGSLQERAAEGEGLIPMGVFSGFNLWLYVGFVTDEATGEDSQIIAGGHVGGVGAVDGVQAFGAIEDWDAVAEYPNGIVPEAIYPKSWVKKDPSMLVVQTQSAPLVYYRRPNACWTARVLG